MNIGAGVLLLKKREWFILKKCAIDTKRITNMYGLQIIIKMNKEFIQKVIAITFIVPVIIIVIIAWTLIQAKNLMGEKMGLKNLVMKWFGETKSGEKWSKKEEADLLVWRSNDMPWIDIAKKLRRTRKAVKSKHYLLLK